MSTATGTLLGAFITLQSISKDEYITSDKIVFGGALGAVTMAYATLLFMGDEEFNRLKNKIPKNKPLNFIQKNYKSDSIVYLDDDDIVITTGPAPIRVH